MSLIKDTNTIKESYCDFIYHKSCILYSILIVQRTIYCTSYVQCTSYFKYRKMYIKRPTANMVWNQILPRIKSNTRYNNIIIWYYILLITNIVYNSKLWPIKILYIFFVTIYSSQPNWNSWNFNNKVSWYKCNSNSTCWTNRYPVCINAYSVS